MTRYNQLPSRFNYERYYLDQAAGGPSFPIFRARQSGGFSFGFLAPLLRRHGVPLLKWLGGQAATLASNLGNTYLQEGRISKENLKNQLKTQGKAAAGSVLDKIKQQIGSGMYRDARLGALVPRFNGNANGLLTNQSQGYNPESIFPVRQTSKGKRKGKSQGKSQGKRKGKRRKTVKGKKTGKGKKTSGKVPKRKTPKQRKPRKKAASSHTIFS